jgi:hypothetical protein
VVDSGLVSEGAVFFTLEEMGESAPAFFAGLGLGAGSFLVLEVEATFPPLAAGAFASMSGLSGVFFPLSAPDLLLDGEGAAVDLSPALADAAGFFDGLLAMAVGIEGAQAGRLHSSGRGISEDLTRQKKWREFYRVFLSVQDN